MFDRERLSLAGASWVDIPWIEPLEAAARFTDMPVSALLDSAGPICPSSRYSYLCADPFGILSHSAGITVYNGEAQQGDVFDVLSRLLARYRLPTISDAPPFTGGAVGYIGYECGAQLQKIACAAADSDDPADLFIAFYDAVVVFDRLLKRVVIVVNKFGKGSSADRLAMFRNRLLSAHNPIEPPAPQIEMQADWSPWVYRDKVTRVLDYIAAGDIFQTNLTMRHQGSRTPNLSGHAVYAALCRHNPARFGAWLRCGSYELCCSSPERFLALDTFGLVQAEPIKGTAARGNGPAEDTQAARALEESAKDRAENVMIVDVLRHDIGRVAETGSIAVPLLCAVQSTATLHHLVSHVTGRLRPDLGAPDLLRAALPGGSITGAPKHRAMQIIAELEGVRRGIYCGCAVWLGFDGAMDSNIVIRSVVLTSGRVIAQAGGGIVADSDPDQEYAEMMLKVGPVLAALKRGM